MESGSDIIYDAWCKRKKDLTPILFNKMTEPERRVNFLLDCFEFYKMVRGEEFADYFFCSFEEARKVDPVITKAAVFDRLNTIWETVTGETRYASYDSFRRRHKDDKQKK